MTAVLAGCGSDSGGSSPTLSVPPPPVSQPLNGSYDLVVVPAAACSLPGTPYVLQVEVTSFATLAGTELRATLPAGGDALTLDMLYPMTGRLQGALSTRAEVPLTANTWVRLRNTGAGTVSLAASHPDFAPSDPVTVELEPGTRADAKNSIELISLGAPCGTAIDIEAAGPDAADAVDALADMFESRFGLEPE